MIHIRANREENFVELHIKSGGRSVSFPGCEFVTVQHLDDLIDALLEAQSFLRNEPKPVCRIWETE